MVGVHHLLNRIMHRKVCGAQHTSNLEMRAHKGSSSRACEGKGVSDHQWCQGRQSGELLGTLEGSGWAVVEAAAQHRPSQVMLRELSPAGPRLGAGTQRSFQLLLSPDRRGPLRLRLTSLAGDCQPWVTCLPSTWSGCRPFVHSVSHQCLPIL